jgi:hypothetical protein
MAEFDAAFTHGKKYVSIPASLARFTTQARLATRLPLPESLIAALLAGRFTNIQWGALLQASILAGKGSNGASPQHSLSSYQDLWEALTTLSTVMGVVRGGACMADFAAFQVHVNSMARHITLPGLLQALNRACARMTVNWAAFIHGLSPHRPSWVIDTDPPQAAFAFQAELYRAFPIASPVATNPAPAAAPGAPPLSAADEATARQRGLCFRFLGGLCERGAECRFLHQPL